MSALDDLLFGPVKKRDTDADGPTGGGGGGGGGGDGPSVSKPPAAPQKSTIDDLFGPAPVARRPAAEKKKKSAADWLGVGGSDDSEDGGLGSALASKKKEKPRAAAARNPDPLSFLDDPPKATTPAAAPRAAPAAAAAAAPAPPVAQPVHQPQQQIVYQQQPPQQIVQQQPMMIAAPQQMSVSAEIVEQNHQKTVERLKEEIHHLNETLVEEKRHWRAERESLLNEWKEKLREAQDEADAEANRLKLIHKSALSQQKDEHDETMDRLRQNMMKEMETLSSTQQQSKSYAEVAEQVTTAVATLSHLSTKVAARDSDSDTVRIKSIEEREKRIETLQQRLDTETAALAAEKDRVQTLLAKLELNLKDQESQYAQEKARFENERQAVNREKLVMEEQKTKFQEQLTRQSNELAKAKESFLLEQQTLMERILVEQERAQQTSMAFTIQRDSDLAKIRQEALLLEDKSRNAQVIENRGKMALKEAEIRQRKLMELEQALYEDKQELDRKRFDLERQRDGLQFKIQEFETTRELPFQFTKSSSAGKYGGSLDRRDSGRLRMTTNNNPMDTHELLKTRANELVERQISLHRRYQQQQQTSNPLMTPLRQNYCIRCDTDGQSGAGVGMSQFSSGSPGSPQEQAEKPYDLEHVHHHYHNQTDAGTSSSNHRRVGSIRSTLRNQARNTEAFVRKETPFIESLNHQADNDLNNADLEGQ